MAPIMRGLFLFLWMHVCTRARWRKCHVCHVSSIKTCAQNFRYRATYARPRGVSFRFVSIMTSTWPCAGQGTLTQHRVRPCADSFLHLDNRVWRKKIFIFINSTLLFSFYPILVWTICHVSMDKLLFSFYPILVWAICHVSMDISRDIMSASLGSTVVSMTQHLHRVTVKSSQ
jgi:hypothetical protein